ELGQKSEWYMYDGSHWKEDPAKPKRGIDFARNAEGRGSYIFHFLFGHHGVFLLSPIFLLSLAGMVSTLKGNLGRPPPGDAPEDAAQTGGLRPPLALTFLAALSLYLTVVVVGFYLFFSDNYGGWTCGPRWLIWLTPFWLLTMLPIVDRLST